MTKRTNIPIHHPKTENDFRKLNNELNRRGYVAIDALKPGKIHEVSLALADGANGKAQDLSQSLGSGVWSKGPISMVAWNFDDRNSNPQTVKDENGKELGLGYIRWGANNNIPSTIPVLAQALPYTAAPLRYIADLTAGLGPRLMYRFEDGTMCEFRDAGDILLQKVESLEVLEDDPDEPEIVGQVHDATTDSKKSTPLKRARAAYKNWKETWYGYDVREIDGSTTHVPGAKEFLESNNLNLHLSQCEQDDVMLDIYFPTVGFQRGRRGAWDPKIVRVGMLPAHSCRMERMNEYRHINHVYFSDQWRTLGQNAAPVATNQDALRTVMYPAAMPQQLLDDLRYIVENNQRTRIKDRPTWVVCPTFYPSGQKPYYPQPAWWSIFTSKAFDFSSTILYDKAKARENVTSWGKIIYVSLDYLDQVFSDEGLKGNKEKQEEFLSELESSMENFLQHRENHGKMMRQWMWVGPDGKDHHSVEIADVAEITKNAVSAGKDELELSTSPIFLALQVDPRLVGVPMVAASNGGTALREMHLLKQQQLNVKQRLYLSFLNTICRFNMWDEHCSFEILQQTLSTLDRSSTGVVDTVAGGPA